MAYEKHSWTAAETITAAKLNNLEEGVQTALDQSANVVSESSLTGLRGDINNIQTQVNDLRTSINTKEDTLNSRITNVANSQVSQSDLTNLESRVHNDLITTTSGYDSRISTNAANISTNNATLERHETDIAKISPMQTEITGAHRTQNDTLDARFDDIDTSITALQTNLGVASDSTVAATGLHADVEALQAAIGTNEGSSLSGRVTTLENTASAIGSEIEGAHTQEYTTLDARFDAVEEKANAAAVASNVTEALSGKQDKITASGLLKGDGNGGVTAAVAGTDYLVQHQDISGKADTSTVTTLTNRVTALESRDTEIITVEAFNVLNANAENSTKDYLVGPNSTGKYLYYRIIETSTGVYTKVLISSAGSGESGGNTSGMDLTAEEYAALTTHTENTDYYVTREDGVHHYRYVATTPNGELHEIEIGQTLDTNKIKRYNMEKVYDKEDNKFYLKLYQYDYNEDNNKIDSNLTDVWQWKPEKSYGVDDKVVYSDGYVYKCITANSDNEWTITNWEKISTICTISFVELPEGGGGMYEYIRLSPSSNQNTVFTTVSSNTAPIPLSLEVYKRDQIGYIASTITITMQYHERGASTWQTYAAAEKDISVTAEGATTFTTVDISPLLVLNKTIEIRVIATDKNNADLQPSSTTFSISKAALSLTTTFNQSAPYTSSSITFNYSYTGTGLNKILYFYLDNKQIAERNLGTGIGNGSYDINMSDYAAGTHALKAYYTTDDGNSSNVLNYFIMYIPEETTLTHPIIGISIEDTTITEGDVLTVYYSTYTQNAETTENALFEILSADSSSVYTSKIAKNIENNKYEPILFTDYPTPAGNDSSTTFIIRATASNEGQESYSIEQTITVNRYSDTTIDFNPIDSNLIYEFDPINHTNNDINRAEFTYSPNTGTTYTTTLKNFNWTSNGYLGDEALTFNGEAKMYINVPVLTTNITGINANDSPTSSGRTIEFEYEVGSVTDINAPIISYFNNSNTVIGTDTNTKTGIGFEITPQNCYLISESKSVVTDKKGFIYNENNIAAAYLSEGNRIRVAFVIEAKGTHETGAGDKVQTINIYVNGQYANSCPYDGNSELFTVPSEDDCKIIIGNDSSILKLYGVRIYNRGLTESEILQNYVTAPLLRRDKIIRIRNNDLLTANKEEIDYYKARQNYNCLLITGNLSPAKSEKVSCGLIFTQPNSEAGDGFDIKFECMDKVDGAYTSQNAVQGTSSVKFPVKNYKIYLTKYNIQEEKVEKLKYALEPGRTGESTFCWKGDYMSSDHANTFNANWADALESRIDGSNHVQNSVYGFRCLLFYRENENENTPIVLIGDGTLNNDKGNTATFQLEDKNNDSGNDTRSQKWEFKNNTKTPCLFQSDILEVLNSDTIDYTTARNAFESTYPDEGDLDKAGIIPNYNHLQILLSWVFRRANYWDETNATLRADKKKIFKNEFNRHFNMQHMLLYYLFCEFTAMTDNRAKNMFIRCDTVRDEHVLDASGNTLFSGNIEPAENSDWYKYITGNNAYKAAHYNDINWTGSTFGIWTPILYDLDSCYGVENSGYLQVPYYAQWNYRDVANTKYLFNGYESRLWLMFEDSFADEIREMAQTIYVDGANGEPGLNYNSFYKYHITNNAMLFPSVIINQDMNKKYLNPWINGLPDPEDATETVYNSEYKYLQRGSRTDQKVGFIERRARMLYSKYLTTQFISNEASINFRCGNAGAEDPITLTASTACYPAIQFSDTSTTTVSTQQQYANTGESIEFIPDEPMGFSDTIYIRGASMLTGIEGIGGYMPYEINLSGGRNLKQLILGSSTIVNTQASSLSNLSACSILEDLNVENFNGTSFTSLDLTSNKLLKNLYATGTNNLGTCSFANGGIIEKIELGTGLTNLTLRNQTRIQSLKFGGSGTVAANNISKINTIFVENISKMAMSTVQEVFKLRLLALRDQLANENTNNEAIVLGGGVRISGLNMTLNCRDSNDNILEDADILDLLINTEAMKGKGLTHDGVLSNTLYPYLSGTLTINRGQDKKIAALHAMYPYLEIIDNDHVSSCTVTYKYDDYQDDDGNEIKGKVITTLYIDNGQSIPDIVQQTNPITGETTHILDEMPSRAATIKKTYQFGKRESGNYIESSGWKETLGATEPFSTMPTASGDSMTVYTYFEESDTQYQIRWYLEKDSEGNPVESSLVKTSNTLVPYGGGENEKSPTVIDIHNKGLETASVTVNGNLVTYRIFTGWEKLPINITPTVANQPYNIFATWDKQESKPLTEVFSDTSNLTPAQLLVLSALNTSGRSNYANNAASIGVKVSCDLGHDSIESGTEIIGPNATRKILRLDLSTTPVLNTSIQPLASGNDAFTIAIDYCLNENATYNSQISAAIIASCYYWDPTPDVTTGFALYHNLNSNMNAIGPRVGFGDMLNSSSYSKPVGSSINSSSRNLVVLRHPAGSNTLYIYSTLMDTNGTISPSVITSSITYNNSTSNAYLVFGQLTNDTDSKYNDLRSITTRAASTIYWAKYWDKDLGAGECERIATWPHENVTFAFSSVESSTTTGNRVIGTSAPSPALRLTTLSGSMHGKVIEENASTTIGSLTGWGTSKTKEICNGTLMLGLPIELQSILCKASTAYFNLAPKEDNMMASYSLANTQTSTRDYIAAPSARSLGSKTATTTYDAEENNDNLEPYRWLEDDSRVQIYDYNTGTNSWTENTTESNRAHYLNLRFPGYTLTGSSVNPLRIFRASTGSISSSSTIYDEINKVGIQIGDVYINTSGKAYVFISNSDINDKGLQREPNTGLFVTPNGGWLLANEYRTRSMGYGSQRVNYIYIKSDGTLMMSETNTASSYGTGLNYSIAI